MQPHKDEWNNLQEYFTIFQSLSQQFLDRIADDKVGKLDPSLDNNKLSQNGINLKACVDKLENDIIPQLSASPGPRYWAYVTGGATPIATMADWLVSVFDQNTHKAGDSIASLVELQAIEWLTQLFDLPSSFEGVMPTGGTGCNFIGACIARQYAGNRQGIDVAKEGVYNLDIEIFSTTPHASMVKSLGMAGLGQHNITKIKAINNSEKMDVEDLNIQLEKSSAKAKIIIASAGTVTATDFDDLEAIADLSEEHQAWLHVDGAFGLFERIVTGSEGKTKGVERADSITVDCHKWLNVPYDCGVFLTRHLSLLEESFDVPAHYLLKTTSRPDFMSLGIENSRRFRALPVWLTLLAYGKNGIKHWVENNIRLSKDLAHWIDASEGYELSYPCQMNVVLFRVNSEYLSDEEADIKTKQLLTDINQDGRFYVSPGIWNGRETIRLCLSNWQTDESDIEIAKQVLTELN